MTKKKKATKKKTSPKPKDPFHFDNIPDMDEDELQEEIESFADDFPEIDYLDGLESLLEEESEWYVSKD